MQANKCATFEKQGLYSLSYRCQDPHALHSYLGHTVFQWLFLIHNQGFSIKTDLRRQDYGKVFVCVDELIICLYIHCVPNSIVSIGISAIIRVGSLVELAKSWRICTKEKFVNFRDYEDIPKICDFTFIYYLLVTLLWVFRQTKNTFHCHSIKYTRWHKVHFN